MPKTKIDLRPSKLSLTAARTDLELGLKKYGRDLPRATRLRYETALRDMEVLGHFMDRIGCDPPDMTFELPGPLAAFRPAPMKGRGTKQRRRGKKR